MDILNLEVIGAVSGVCTLAGGGIGWVWTKISTRHAALEQRVEALVTAQVAELRREIRLQDREIGYLRRLSDAYLRHIAILEGLMRSKGIEIPPLVLPKEPEHYDDADRRARRRDRAS